MPSNSKTSHPEYLATHLVDTFDTFVSTMNAFCQKLEDLNPPAWLPLSEEEQSLSMTHLQKAIQFYRDIWYVDGQDGRETRSCFGIIGVPTSVIEDAKVVNDTKNQFQKAVQALQKNKALWDQTSDFLNERHPNVRETLMQSRLARVHLKQCYRYIPYVEQKPIKIGFSWYKSGRSIKRIDVETAIQSLEKLDLNAPHIQAQIAKVSTFPKNMPLAKVQTLAPIMRANLVYAPIDSSEEKKRQAMNISLPLLIPLFPGADFPQYNKPPLTPPEKRTRIDRSDILIDPEPFLPSIRVHRYTKEPL